MTSAAHTPPRKVVINACFGGFGVSAQGMEAYIARKGKPAFFYLEDRASAEKPGDRDYVRKSAEDAQREKVLLGPAALTEDIGERVSHETMWPNGQKHPAYIDDSDIARDDPDLVAVVEELGDEASDSLANLQVVEIPADAAWEIAEYDGYEHVAEVHRTWL
jgi:hypothetical protein